MLLTLLQPSESLYLPTKLQSHHVPLPTSASYTAKPTRSQPNPIRYPPPYIKLERLLRDLGISTPSKLAGDRAVWYAVAVSEVQWDVEGEMCCVHFVDGTREEWSLGDDEQGADGDASMGGVSIEECVARWGEKVLGTEREGTTRSSGKAKAREGATSVYNRLLELCAELRSAYEDVGAALGTLRAEGGGTVDVETEWELLMSLSADPSLPLPPSWGGPPPRVVSSRPSTSKRRTRSATPELEDDSSIDLGSSDDESTTSSADPFEHSGQIRSNRRPTSFAPSHPLSHPRLNAYDPVSSSFELLSSNRQPHDILSFIALLTRTRETLLDVFSGYVIPILKERLPPTYGLWTTSGALRWCRRAAILQSADVAGIILSLVEDEGDEFDATDDEDDDELESDGMSEGEEDWNADKETRAERRERRMERNILHSMRDDLGLRMWCERAQSRAAEEKEGGTTDGEDDCSLLDNVRPWEVSKVISERSKLSARKQLARKRKSKTCKGKKTTSSASFAHDDHPNSSDDTRSDSSTESYYRDPFFYPSDPLGEALLPPKLPKTVVKRSPFPPLGRDMSRMRESLHSKLNDVAGLQLKMVQLSDFIDTQTTQWETSRAEERKEKEPSDEKPKKKSSRSIPPKLRLRKLNVDKVEADIFNADVAEEVPELAAEAEEARMAMLSEESLQGQNGGLTKSTEQKGSECSVDIEVDGLEREGGARKKIKLDKSSVVVLGESNREMVPPRSDSKATTPPRRAMTAMSIPHLTPPNRVPKILIHPPTPNTSPTFARMSLDELSTHRHAPISPSHPPSDSVPSSMDEDVLTESDSDTVDEGDIQVDLEDTWKVYQPFVDRPFETFEQYQLSHPLRSSPPPIAYNAPSYPTSSERSFSALPTRPTAPCFGDRPLFISSSPLRPATPFTPHASPPSASAQLPAPVVTTVTPVWRPRSPEKGRIPAIAEEGEDDVGRDNVVGWTTGGTVRQLSWDDANVRGWVDESAEDGRREEAGRVVVGAGSSTEEARSQVDPRISNDTSATSARSGIDEVAAEGMTGRKGFEDIQ